jgi:hypothetical protein
MQSDAKVGRGGAAFVFRFYVQEKGLMGLKPSAGCLGKCGKEPPAW